MRFCCPFIDELKLVVANVFLIKRRVELAFYFRTRSLGVSQKLGKLCIASAIESFRDVVHRGPRRLLNLISQSEVSAKGRVLGGVINQARQLASYFPALYIFKSLNLHGIRFRRD